MNEIMTQTDWLICLWIGIICIGQWNSMTFRTLKKRSFSYNGLSSFSNFIFIISNLGLIGIAILLACKSHWWWLLLVPAIYIVAFIGYFVVIFIEGLLMRIIFFSPDENFNSNFDNSMGLCSIAITVFGWYMLIAKLSSLSLL